MAYKKYRYGLWLRLLCIVAAVALVLFAFQSDIRYLKVASVLLLIFSFIWLYNFIEKRFTAVNDFLESVKYRDFSRWFNEGPEAGDLNELYKGFNTVIKTVKAISKEKEVQQIYLSQILEMVDTGIIAYNMNSGRVLLANNAFLETLGLPSFKKTSFIEKRKPEVFETIFEKEYPETTTVSFLLNQEKTTLLVSGAIFFMEEQPYKIVALQNVNETIDQTEAEAWKKLLSVMTHEIMNSIAPISSLAETLQNSLMASEENPKENPLELEDLKAGIGSIKKRSEGLMLFAKTYRSLNKITHLNTSKVKVATLFVNIKNLMLPSLKSKQVEVVFNTESPHLEVEIDAYLIEQVLINLILNALDAVEGIADATVRVLAFKNSKGQVAIRVADNGMGIPDEILDHVFVPFFTTKKTGSGIGLSLCKQIMLLHKGKISIQSIAGKGTVVSLVF